MKKIIYILLVIMFAHSMVYCMDVERIEYKSSGLLLFLDDTEHNEIGAVSQYLLSAIRQKAGPIVVSASLLENIFSLYYEAQGDRESAADLYIKYVKDVEDQSGNIKKIKIFYLKTLHFDPREWIFKKVSNFLYLLIPKGYIQASFPEIWIDRVERYDPRNISQVELLLGLKVNHMETVDFKNIVSIKVTQKDNSDYFLDDLYNDATKKSSIFCVKSDYKSRGARKIPVWSFYMHGHGIMQYHSSKPGIIVGLSHRGFGKFLDFSENKIVTRLLIYISCYSAGISNDIIFKDAESGVRKTYSFAIITQAISEVPISSVRAVQWSSDGRAEVTTLANFAYFLSLVRSTDIFDYIKIAESLFPIIPTVPLFTQEPWGHVPQIKLPGIEWFSVMASRQDIVSIGSILAKTRSPNKPLDIVNFFKSREVRKKDDPNKNMPFDPKAILLYASVIPFELIINARNLEAIISMIPGDAIHVIKKISSSTKTEQELLQSFMSIAGLETRKIFFIEELNTLKNVIIYNVTEPKIIPLSRRRGEYQLSYPGIRYCFALYEKKYEKNNILYKKEAKSEEHVVRDASFIKGYADLLAEARAFKDEPSLLSRENLEKMSATLAITHEIRKKAKLIKKQQKSNALQKSLEELQQKLIELHAKLSRQKA